MGTSLAVVNKELSARLPVFQQVLPPSVSPQRLMRTVMMSCERNPRILQCTPQSIINAATTAAVLGLECDGVTGQGFIVPYGDIATFQVGYKGFNTMGARAGYTITGEVVREGDEFEYQLGTGAFVRHRPLPRPISNRRIIMAWAVAEAHGRPNIVVVMSIEEIEQVKAKSQGARKKDSPWNDLNGPGYPAMCAKTAKRRLARSMPLSVMQQAAALDSAHDRGAAAYITPAGDMRVVGEASAAEGPVSHGDIMDAQPKDILSPANARPADDMPDHFDEPPPPDKTTTIVNALIERFKTESVDDVLADETVRKQVAWMLDKRPAEHKRLFDAANAKRREQRSAPDMSGPADQAEARAA